MTTLREASRARARNIDAVALALSCADRRTEERLPCAINNPGTLPSSPACVLRGFANAWQQCIEVTRSIAPSLAGPLAAVLIAVAPTAATAFEIRFDPSGLGHSRSERKAPPPVDVVFSASDGVIENMQSAGITVNCQDGFFVARMAPAQLQRLRISERDHRAVIHEVHEVKPRDRKHQPRFELSLF